MLPRHVEFGYFAERRADPEHEIMFMAEPKKRGAALHGGARGLDCHTWAPLWRLWVTADANIKKGSKTLADYGGTLLGEEPPEHVRQLFQYGEARIRPKLGSPEYRECPGVCIRPTRVVRDART